MKREGLVILLICIILNSIIFSTVLSEYKTQSGNDVTPRSRAILIVGSDQTYATISSAVTAANPGDTIMVYAGVYNENVLIDKTLTLIGNGSADTIIQMASSDVPLQISADWCNVSGFSLRGSGNGATDAGLLINSFYNQIWDCNCSDNQGNGIRIEALGGNNTIENCIVMNNSRNGVRIQTSPSNIIRNCTIMLNQENGLHLQNTYGNIIENNSITKSFASGKSSISISSVNDNIIKFNYLESNDHGISVAMGDDNLIIYNTIVNTSSYAIEFGGASDDNLIHHNNFIECNKSGASATDGGTGNIWNISYPKGGNYWFDWVTPDLLSGVGQDQPGSDGFVDEPYDLDGSAGTNDSYPLADPFIVLEIKTGDNETAIEDLHYTNTYNAWTNWLGTILIWSLETNASWLNLVDTTLDGTPTNADVGTYWVNISVSNALAQDSQNFTLTVLNVNDAPEIVTEDVTSANETQLYSVDYNAIDIDPTNDTLNWNLHTNATFFGIDSETGILSGTPSYTDAGDYWVNVSVSDNNNGWDHSNFSLNIRHVNIPPTINSSWANFSFDEDTVDESILLNQWFRDDDGDDITFGYSGNNKLVVSILPSGIVRLVPKANWSGFEILTFYANDSILKVSDWVNITVLPINDAPFNAEIEIIASNFTEGNNLTLKGTCSDVDIAYGDNLNYQWSSNISGPLGQGQEINLSLDAGLHKIILNVTDSYNAWTIATKELPILPFIEDKNETDYNKTNGDTNKTDNGNQTNNGNGNETDGTNKTDTDNDNLPDPWEDDNFGNLNQTGTDDPDSDSFTNYQEWENETDPNDPNDYPGKLPEQPDDKDDDDDESSFITDNWWWLLLLLLIIIIILIFAIVSRRKEEEEEKMEEEEGGEEEKEDEAEDLDEVGTEAEEDILECPECGAVMDLGEKSCVECGVEFDLEDEEITETEIENEDELGEISEDTEVEEVTEGDELAPEDIEEMPVDEDLDLGEEKPDMEDMDDIEEPIKEKPELAEESEIAKEEPGSETESDSNDEISEESTQINEDKEQ
jgi:parallel beta-helix repeat protein